MCNLDHTENLITRVVIATKLEVKGEKVTYFKDTNKVKKC